MPGTVKNQRTHIVVPAELVAEIDSLVGKRQRSAFLTQAASREVKRLRMLRAIESAAGSWKDEDHPELKHGSVRWVRKLRQESEDRFQKIRR